MGGIKSRNAPHVVAENVQLSRKIFMSTVGSADSLAKKTKEGDASACLAALTFPSTLRPSRTLMLIL